MVGQGFQSLLSAGNATVDAVSSGPSISERLQTLASELREWLSQNGVGGPFALQIDLPPGESEPVVSVDGFDSQKIRTLLSREPQRLEPLKEIVALSGQPTQWSPLGMRSSSVLITETDVSLTY